ncbi:MULTISPECIES: hypothetical protein [unclassified Rhodococcus (in: high G+C Gram-positive bacteria)]|uniref:hypothetical protein n=1 Tax=unclassified Rhodococcus (in: high G+C Gram-positive bacteria) TaxID=192944 RepID=UPI00117BAB73|nr:MULTISPECIES: hypothetical protein [unclassified Rhodococcus (in: high G+C Gram-positive bacteria)]
MTPDILATSAIDQLMALPIFREAGPSGLVFDRRSCRYVKVKPECAESTGNSTHHRVIREVIAASRRLPRAAAGRVPERDPN